jgi:hypothetical protein
MPQDAGLEAAGWRCGPSGTWKSVAPGLKPISCGCENHGLKPAANPKTEGSSPLLLPETQGLGVWLCFYCSELEGEGVRRFAFYAAVFAEGEGCRIEGEYYQVSPKRIAWPM